MKCHQNNCLFYTTDLALIKIDRPFTKSKRIKVIQMNERFTNLAGKRVTMSGWGATEKERNPMLLSETSNIIAEDVESYGMSILRIPNTGMTGVTSACFGDSGGNTLHSYW